MNLTPKQLKILTRIRDFRLTRGLSPTMQELADELGVSKVTVFEHVEALIRKGALHREPNKARSLELTREVDLPDERRSTRLPLVGTIAAGSPIEAVEDREHLDLEDLFIAPGKGGSGSGGGEGGGNKFVLRVRGDSMIEDCIRDGDFVICEKRNAARNGETVVALLSSGEATLKRMYKEKDGRIRLQPANERFEPIYVQPDDLTIQGVCIGVVRSC